MHLRSGFPVSLSPHFPSLFSCQLLILTFYVGYIFQAFVGEWKGAKENRKGKKGKIKKIRKEEERERERMEGGKKEGRQEDNIQGSAA